MTRASPQILGNHCTLPEHFCCGHVFWCRLSGGDTKETVLLKAPHKFKDDDAGSDDEGAPMMDMSAFLSSGNK